MKYAISACLCGKLCRYDGKTTLNKKAAEIYERGEAILICPETDGGLKTPRSPCEIKNGRVISRDGRDCTEEYVRGAEAALKKCTENEVEICILKQRSPSCGSRQIYDGSFSGRLIDGKGITAKLLSENGFKVISEEEL